jgi:hypothetical protein
MRLLVPVCRCDGCSADIDPAVKPTTVEVTQVGRTRRLTGDLCEDCGIALADLIAQVADLLTEPKAAKAKPAIVEEDLDDVKYRTCKACGHVSKNRTALGTHCRVRHGLPLSELGEPLPKRKAS